MIFCIADLCLCVFAESNAYTLMRSHGALVKIFKPQLDISVKFQIALFIIL